MAHAYDKSRRGITRGVGALKIARINKNAKKFL